MILYGVLGQWRQLRLWPTNCKLQLTSWDLQCRQPVGCMKNVSCQDAPIPGFNSGSVYKGVACCGNTSPAPEVKIIPAYPMQGGAYTTPCPVVGVEVPRAGLATHTYYMNFSVSVHFDGACANSFGTGFKAVSLKTVNCAADSRGPGFGPNNKADLKCSK